ncbi:hypothetical protein C8R46DRAFT_1191576 [Mycena filopes]|nr:hypothetical protein C8R46DRAFT_1191576 [Mycena filopes]
MPLSSPSNRGGYRNVRFTVSEDFRLTKYLAHRDDPDVNRSRKDLYALLGPKAAPELAWSRHRSSSSWRMRYKNNKSLFDDKIRRYKAQFASSSAVGSENPVPSTQIHQDTVHVLSSASSTPAHAPQSSPPNKVLALQNLRSLLAAERAAAPSPRHHRGELAHPSFLPRSLRPPTKASLAGVRRVKASKAFRPAGSSTPRRQLTRDSPRAINSSSESASVSISVTTVPAPPSPAPTPAHDIEPAYAPVPHLTDLLSTSANHPPPTQACEPERAEVELPVTTAAHRTAKTHRKLARMARRTGTVSRADKRRPRAHEAPACGERPALQNPDSDPRPAGATRTEEQDVFGGVCVGSVCEGRECGAGGGGAWGGGGRSESAGLDGRQGESQLNLESELESNLMIWFRGIMPAI